ncbi:MAG TPA: selenium cofactor biosynthesis protein YqeC [Anaerolineales bacterium]|nr:selenium cofactor biosynthesis protein YqeC [Anaerolineales bacterium]
MKLIDALRLNLDARLALVGAGGKSSALFRIGRELSAIDECAVREVWLSASTHLSSDQLQLADHAVELNEPSDFYHYLESPTNGLVLFTGPPVENERSAGLTPSLMMELKLQADLLGIPVILEADGSRRLPLKAPAGHEPVIPEWVNQVVVVAGLSALGKPLTHEWVHRPEIFSELSGLSLGEPVTGEAIAAVLGSSNGGLKGIPEHARRILLLNQACSDEQKAAGQWIASQLQDVYHAIVLANLQPPLGEGKILAVYERVAGVVLAAGCSKRLGRPKQLLMWRNHPLVYHAASIALHSGLKPVIVITGYAADDVARAIESLPVLVVENPNWKAGQGASVASSIEALPEEVGAAVFFLSDQPLVPSELVHGLLASHAESLSPIVAPLVNGRRSNPVLFDRKLFPELSQLSGEQGGRVLFSRYPVKWIDWVSDNVDLDVDTEQDYQRLLTVDNNEL